MTNKDKYLIPTTDVNEMKHELGAYIMLHYMNTMKEHKPLDFYTAIEKWLEKED